MNSEKKRARFDDGADYEGHSVSILFFFPEFFSGEGAVLYFSVYYEKICLDRQRFFPLSSSLAKEKEKKQGKCPCSSREV